MRTALASGLRAYTYGCRVHDMELTDNATRQSNYIWGRCTDANQRLPDSMINPEANTFRGPMIAQMSILAMKSEP